MAIEIRASVAGKIGFASHQNAVPVIRDLELVQDGGVPVENVILTLAAEPPFLAPKTWRLDKIGPGESLHLPDRDTPLNATYLSDLTESLSGTLLFRLEGPDGELATLEAPVELLARSQWGGCEGMMELLPAFVMPNDPAVDKVLKAASEVLRRAGKKDGIDGYEAKSRTRVWEISSAIWSAVCGLRLSYTLPPASFERNGQKVRTPGAVLEGGVATCLDTALLFAATLEQAGLNPLVIITKGHAFVGVWLQPVEFAALVTDESAALRRRIDLQDLIVFETTLAAQANPPGFEQAQKVAKLLLAEDAEFPFEMAVDVRRARMQKIRPLAQLGPVHAIDAKTDVTPVFEALEDAPLLPGFDVEVPEDENAVTDRIGQWQRKLLNLTTSNRLLHVPDRGTIVRLICPDPTRLEDKLAEGKKFRIIPMPDLAPGGRDEKLYESQTNENLRQQVAENALEKNEVLALNENDNLDATLIDLYRKARSDIEEGGANTLFLVLGFLKWKKLPTDEKSYRAPLILLPVKLERKSALTGVTMVHHEDDPRFNLTLLELLRQDFELNISGLDGELPADESGIDVAGIWTTVRRAIRDIPGFEVVPDVVLSTFSFAKYLMWKDLVDRADRLKESPIVRHLIERQGEGLETFGELPRAEELDDKVDPVGLFTPLPADSSQLADVVASAAVHNFVLDGPPGTGKSQTIANMIAHNLALGRRVLFVAEKMAALKVVRRRLEERGLGDFCLELHSNKATKSEVLKQLDRAWIARDAMSQEEWDREATKTRLLRDNLNRIVRLLHKTAANGFTLHWAIGRVVRDWSEATPRLTFASGTTHDTADIERFRDIARRLGIVHSGVDGLPEGFTPMSCRDWSNGWQEAIVAAARDLPAKIKSLVDARDALLAATGLPVTADDAAGLARLRKIVSVALRAAGRDARLAFSNDWQEKATAARGVISQVERYRAIESSLSAEYAPEAARRLDLVGMQANWEAAGRKFWPLRMLAKRNLAKVLRQAGNAAAEVNPETDLPRLFEMANLLTEIDARSTQIVDFPGWSGLTTDLAAIEEHCAFIEGLRRDLFALAEDPEHLTVLTRAARQLLVDANDLLSTGAAIDRADARMASALDTASQAALHFSRLAELPEDASHAALLGVAEVVVSHEPHLKAWTDWRKVRDEAMMAGLAPMVVALEQSALPAAKTVEVFETAYARWFASVGIDAEPTLRAFASSVHMDDIEEFRRLDDHMAELTVRYIRAKLSSAIPAKESVTTKTNGFSILKHQLQLQRRHKPIRQLAAEMNDAFTRLAPCMLMSPLSIAQYLPPDQALFDLVIFDEASQITPWDAIGAMARGRQVVVAGDPRQMPPTSFFARSQSATDGDTDTEEDMESILDECLAAGISVHSLSWHYRSRHESLIAFSNHRYYENSLVTFPAPVTRASAVEWRRVEGVYAKGKGRTNQIEAQAMVDQAVGMLKAPDFNAGKKSLGIITLNADQQKLVEDLLDKARRDHPSIERHFSPDLSEPVVVKNLETVQGDERDVIILGIGFGPTEPGSPSMSMHFGALNRDGGHRRLNVALSRARQEMIVYTSFDPGMIDLSRTNARAVRDLKHFIEFADRGPRALAEATNGSLGGYDSPFEEAVARELIRRGWEVVPQIGVSRFRIDLGIVHPDRPGDYLVGVECDGATYHSAATARDRDKVRSAILKDLGWNLLRVWSTDWWNNKQGAAEKLHLAIEAALSKARETYAPRPTSEMEVAAEIVVEAEVEIAEAECAHAHGVELSVSLPARVSLARDLKTSIEAQLYQLADFAAYGGINADRFYESNYDETLAELIAHVVAVEAPISEANLVRRIARAHGFQRAGQRIRERVLQLARPAYYMSSEFNGTDAFVWPDAQAPETWDKFRVPATEQDIRQIEEIALPELRAALEASLAENKAIDVARKFGIKRLSEPARQRLEAAKSLQARDL